MLALLGLPVPDSRGTGNRCGFNPKAPLWDLRCWTSKRGHKFMRAFAEKSRRILTDPHHFHELLKRSRGRRPTKKNRALGKEWVVLQRRRPERLVALVQILGALAFVCDVLSVTAARFVLIDAKKVPFGFTEAWLAEQTGLSRWRITRAIKDLVDAGFMTTTQYRQRTPEGGWRGFAAVRSFTPQLFAKLGMAERLKDLQKGAYARQEFKKKPRGRSAPGAFSSLVEDVLRGQHPERLEDPTTLLQLRMSVLRRIHRDWTEAQLREEAMRFLS